jgi:hypothetical protein
MNMDNSESSEPPVDETKVEGTENSSAAEEQPVPKAKVHRHHPKLMEAVERGVEAWYERHIRNTTLARDTPAYNHLQSVISELSKCIGKELGDE